MLLFSYGSKSPLLTSRPACALDYERIFAGKSCGWGGGGIASLYPNRGSRVCGSLMDVTTEQLEELKTHEGYLSMYDLQRIRCIFEDTRQEVDAWTFIKKSFTFLLPPTEQYLMAIYHHLKEVGLFSAIEIVGMEIDASGQHTRKVINAGWMPPSLLVQSLPAFFVSVIVRRCELGEDSWAVPMEVNNVVEKLSKIGIFCMNELSVALHNVEELNHCLTRNSYLPFYQSTLDAMLDVLGLHRADSISYTEIDLHILDSENGPLPEIDVENSSVGTRTKRLFVYGSLLSSLQNHILLKRNEANFVSEAITCDEFFMSSRLPGLSFPYMTKIAVLPHHEKTTIKGEVYEVSLSAIPELDNLENHPVWYKRQSVCVQCASESLPSFAEVYILESEDNLLEIMENPDNYLDVNGGDWKAFLLQNRRNAVYTGSI